MNGVKLSEDTVRGCFAGRGWCGGAARGCLRGPARTGGGAIGVQWIPGDNAAVSQDEVALAAYMGCTCGRGDARILT